MQQKMSNYSIKITGVDSVKKKLDKINNVDKIVFQWMASGVPSEIVQASVDKNFQSEGRPKWTSLSDETIKSRISQGFRASPILARTGNLRSALSGIEGKLSHSAGITSLLFGPDQIKDKEARRKYIIHQKGNSKIPKRMMLLFQKEDRGIITENLSQFIFRKLK
jgi:phage gpG-like protein